MKISSKIALFFIVVALFLVVIIITLSIMFTNAKKAEMVQKERFKFHELIIKHKQNTDSFSDIFIKYINTDDIHFKNKVNAVLEKEKFEIKNIKKYRNEILKTFNYKATPEVDKQKEQEIAMFFSIIEIPEQKTNRILNLIGLVDELLFYEFDAINAVRGLYKDKKGEYTVLGEANVEYAKNFLLGDKYKRLRMDINGSIDYLFEDLDFYLLKYINKLEQEEDLAYRFSIYLAILLLVVVFVSYLNFKKSIVIPLEKLTQWIEQMKSNEFVTKERSFQRDEIGIVMNSFINMADTIKKDMRELESLSTTDILTKLKNRVTLDKVLEEAQYNVNRYETAYSVIILDVDFFKDVNDKHGHIIGDVILKEMATVLKDNTRKSDTLGRWGGEEFLIICANTDKKAAYNIAQKLRLAISNYDFTKVGHKTASFGVASFKEGQSVEEVLDIADKALYEAKNSGRNMVVCK